MFLASLNMSEERELTFANNPTRARGLSLLPDSTIYLGSPHNNLLQFIKRVVVFQYYDPYFSRLFF